MKQTGFLLRTLILLGLLVNFSIPPAMADDSDEDSGPILISLTYISLRDQEKKQVDVPYLAGQQISPEAGKGVDRITISQGDPVLSSRRPDNMRMHLYRGAGKQRVLLGALNIRFYSVKDEEDMWQPRFVLATEPLVIRQGNRLVPLENAVGSSSIVLEGGNLPNAHGYYRKLTFTQGIGKTFVDSWQITKRNRF